MSVGDSPVCCYDDDDGACGEAYRLQSLRGFCGVSLRFRAPVGALRGRRDQLERFSGGSFRWHGRDFRASHAPWR